MSPADPGKDKRLSSEDRQLLNRLLRDPTEYPKELGSWIQRYLGVYPPQFVASEVAGLAQTNFSPLSSINNSEAYGATAWGNTATVGPTLSGLRSGRYVLLWEALLKTSNATYFASLAPSVNGADPDSTTAIRSRNVDVLSAMAFTLAELPLPNNTVTMKYRMENAAASGTFNDRQLLAIRIGNV